MAITLQEATRRFKNTKVEKRTFLTEVGFIVEGNMKRRTRVRTGTLRRSETSRLSDSGNAVRIGTNVHYAPYVNYGTRYMAGDHFAERSLEDSRPHIDRRLLEEGARIVTVIANG